MKYMRAYQFIMDRKNWLMNILMGGVCSFIPVVGEIVLDGYWFEMVDSLHRDPEHKDYRDFDFNRFTTYLGRGVWPWLVSYILRTLAFLPAVGIGVVIMFVLMAASKGSPVALLVGELFLFMLVLFAWFLVSIIAWPAMIHTGLSGELNLYATWSFVKDFLRRVKKELVLSILFAGATGIVAYFVGLCALIFGAVFTLFAVNMAAHHLMFQLYELYLERGGTPIQTKEERESRGGDMPTAQPG